MLRLEPDERGDLASDLAALGPPREDVHTKGAAGEVGPDLRTELEVLAHVDPEHHGALTLLQGHVRHVVVAGQELATSRDVETVADHVATHERSTNLVVRRDIIIGLDVVDVEVEAE